MPLVIHSLMKDAIDPDGAITILFVKDDVMPDFMAQESGLDDIVLYFQEGR